MNMLTRIFLLFFCFFSFSVFSQIKKYKLPNKLNEISGLELWQDSILIAVNDSGNDPLVYFMNLSGDIFHTVIVENANNVDWEDLTLDEKNMLYIADVGNNANTRKNLCIYYFPLNGILDVKSIEAKTILFDYEDQYAFLLTDSTKIFDCESIAYANGHIYLFTKDLAVPFRGLTSCYQLNINEKKQRAKKVFTVQTPKRRRIILDAVTSADIYLDTCYLMTYSDIFAFDIRSETPQLFKVKSFGLLSQKEALCIDKQHIYVANEQSASYRKQKLLIFKRK